MSSLKGARIMLTGGNGFLGRYVLPLLEAQGADVKVVSRRYGYDLRNEGEVLTALLLCRPSVIIHLAASWDRPASMYRDNLQMAMNVAHAAAIQNASQERVKLVVLGHPASYSTSGDPMAAEDTFWNAAPDMSTDDGVMGTVKKSILLLCEAYHRQFGLPFAYLIPERLYGPRETTSPVARAVAAIMEAQSRGEPGVSIAEPKGAPKPLLFAQDAAEAVIQAAISEVQGGPINLGSSAPQLTQEALLKLIAKKLSYKGEISWTAKTKTTVPKKAAADAPFPTADLDWKPKTSIEAGIDLYLAWCASMMQQPVEAAR